MDEEGDEAEDDDWGHSKNEKRGDRMSGVVRTSTGGGSAAGPSSAPGDEEGVFNGDYNDL